MHTDSSRDLAAKQYLDRLNGDPTNAFSYERSRIEFKLQNKRKETMHDDIPSLKYIELEAFRKYLDSGRGNYQGAIIKDVIIDFDVSNCNFKNALFADVHFARGVNLNNCIIDKTKFLDCKFDAMVASELEFKNSILLNTDVAWSGNSVPNTIIYNDKATGWDILKSSYTGNGARFHILLSLFYFSPIVMRIISNYILIKYQSLIYPYSDTILVIKTYFSSLEPNGTLFHGLFDTTGIVNKLVLSGVLIYQVQRIVLTFFVGKLADKQKFCNKMPGWITLGSLKKMHFFNTLLTIVVLYGAIVNVLKLMQYKLWI